MSEDAHIAGQGPMSWSSPAVPRRRNRDTGNEFLVGRRGDQIFIAAPITMQPLSRQQALNLAAWLCLVAGLEAEELGGFVEEVASQ